MLQFGKTYTKKELVATLGDPSVEANVPAVFPRPPNWSFSRTFPPFFHEAPAPGMSQFLAWSCEPENNLERCCAHGDPRSDTYIIVRTCAHHLGRKPKPSEALSSDEIELRRRWVSVFWREIAYSLDGLEFDSETRAKYHAYTIEVHDFPVSRTDEIGAVRVSITDDDAQAFNGLRARHNFSIANADPRSAALSVASDVFMGKPVSVKVVNESEPQMLRLVGHEHDIGGLRFEEPGGRVVVVPFARIERLTACSL